MTDFRVFVAERVREVMAERGVLVGTVATRIRWPHDMVRRRLDGESYLIEMSFLAKVAHALGVPVAELLPRTLPAGTTTWRDEEHIVAGFPAA